VSIKNISHNLRDWLIKNGDVVGSRDIINLSLEPKEEEVIEFDPNEYVMVTLKV